MKVSKEVLRSVKNEGLYTLKDEVVSCSINVVSTKPYSKTKIFHMRVGHFSETGMIELGKQNLVGENKVKKLTFCEYCVLGKSESDRWGPARCPLNSGAMYFLSIV